MKFCLPKSFTPNAENVFFVEEAAEAWTHCLLDAAQSVVTTTPVKANPRTRHSTTATTSFQAEQQHGQQLSIDLSGASLPDSTVDFLCATVLPHFFEVAFSTGIQQATTHAAEATPSVFPTLSIRLQGCTLSAAAAVGLVEALVNCAQVFSNTFAPLLQPLLQQRRAAAGYVCGGGGGPRCVFPVDLDLGFNNDLDDTVALEIAGLLQGLYDTTMGSHVVLDASGAPLPCVPLVVDLGLSGSEVGTSGLLRLLQCGAEGDDDHMAEGAVAGPGGVLVGLNMANSQVSFVEGVEMEEDEEFSFCSAVCDCLLVHPSLRCLTLSVDAFEGCNAAAAAEDVEVAPSALLMQRLQMAGKSNVVQGSGCCVVVCDAHGLVVPSHSGGDAVRTFTPRQLVQKSASASSQGIESDTALAALGLENAALRAQLEAMKVAAAKPKKKKIKKVKRVTSQAAVVVVGPAGGASFLLGKENAMPQRPGVGCIRPSPFGNHRSTSAVSSNQSSSTKKSHATSTVRSFSSISNTTSHTQGQCGDCVKLRRALHTHGANRMPTSTLKVLPLTAAIGDANRPSWQ